MSYLDGPRITFFGQFFANPSTINNDRGNYDPSVVLQDSDPNAPGYVSWNPNGSAFFRFVNAKVGGAVGADGSPVAAGSDDPVLGALVKTVEGPPPSVAKLVDLDPDQQGVTQLFGVVVTVALPGGRGSVTGKMQVAELRDLWFQRVPGGGGDGFASGIWQSVLTDLTWSGVETSPLLKQLYDASPHRLSIKFVCDRYLDDSSSPDFNLGRLAGAIGPASSDEPAQVVMGRRLVPADKSCFPAPFVVTKDGRRLVLDLGNSIPLQSPAGDPIFPGPLRAVIQAPAGPITLPTPIDVTSAGYASGAWIFDIPLTADQAKALETSPLGITASDGTPLLAERADGRYVNLEPLSLRLNPGDEGSATLYGTKFGKPLAGAALEIGFDAAAEGDNTPQSALSFESAVVLDTKGRGTLRVAASSPAPLPPARTFVGSQVYFLGGPWEAWGQIGQAAAAGAALSVLVFEDTPSVANPTWEDVGPVLSAYARLYPAMKARLDLADFDAVSASRDEVLDVITRTPLDTAYMPVTRDFSAGRTKMIVTWINNGCPKS